MIVFIEVLNFTLDSVLTLRMYNLFLSKVLLHGFFYEDLLVAEGHSGPSCAKMFFIMVHLIESLLLNIFLLVLMDLFLSPVYYKWRLIFCSRLIDL